MRRLTVRELDLTGNCGSILWLALESHLQQTGNFEADNRENQWHIRDIVAASCLDGAADCAKVLAESVTRMHL